MVPESRNLCARRTVRCRPHTLNGTSSEKTRRINTAQINTAYTYRCCASLDVRPQKTKQLLPKQNTIIDHP